MLRPSYFRPPQGIRKFDFLAKFLPLPYQVSFTLFFFSDISSNNSLSRKSHLMIRSQVPQLRLSFGSSYPCLLHPILRHWGLKLWYPLSKRKLLSNSKTWPQSQVEFTYRTARSPEECLDFSAIPLPPEWHPLATHSYWTLDVRWLGTSYLKPYFTFTNAVFPGSLWLPYWIVQI